ncbi:MAG TPA: GvpL/GvpF family gas vesicle protein, partial [Solirubrobacteraceae bacterium]|nr:GvpL/GvpF family gas vesicle protein [Solirubrobacteraceae bacterium]
VDRRLETATGTDGAVNAAFLVERERTRDFGRALDAAAQELSPRIELRVIGPLPPYSFAADEAAAWA